MSVLGVIDQPADLGVDLPNWNSSSPQDVMYHEGRPMKAYLGVYLPNLNSSCTHDVMYQGVDLPADLGVDLPNSDLILTVRCHCQRGRSAKFELILTTWDVSTAGSRSASISRGISAKFELILTTRCQYQGGRSASRSRGRSGKF